MKLQMSFMICTVKLCEYVIENNLFHELDIPFNLVQIIKDSWENDCTLAPLWKI